MQYSPRRSCGPFFLLAIGVMAWAPNASAQVDHRLASRYFQEIATYCERDGGRLWGVSLCGPIVFADAATGTIATNRVTPDADRPPALGYANAAAEWGGDRWAMLVWGLLPEDSRVRARIILHELFHRVQPELGLLLPEPDNTHLDTIEGRYWMRLEWHALAEALTNTGAARNDAIRDAFAFRAMRRSLFDHAAENERVLEINEGLAEYTAIALLSESQQDASRAAVERLDAAEDSPTLVRTFGYGSGAAYGVLLDGVASGWQRTLNGADDLGTLLANALAIVPTNDVAGAAERYGGSRLWEEELAREEARESRVRELRRRFVDGPVVIVPHAPNYSFNGAEVTPIADLGSVYPGVRATGRWGILEADLALVSAIDATLRIPAPFAREGATITGAGWRLELAEGWTIRAAASSANYEVVVRGPRDLDGPAR